MTFYQKAKYKGFVSCNLQKAKMTQLSREILLVDFKESLSPS
jgi:hypothetical protein